MSEQTFDCCFCGGKVTAQQVDIMRHWKSRYILIENVPTHVCTQCGEKYHDAAVAETMDQIMQSSESELKVKRKIHIPVIEMPFVYSTPQQTGLIIQDKASEPRVDAPDSASEAEKDLHHQTQLARKAFGMWSDRDPDEYLAHSRAGLALRDQEVEDARMGV
ncbi:MAG: type II toxin-antitoxin system MqsA family antitoxin [Anaerolineae bacterium]